MTGRTPKLDAAALDAALGQGAMTREGRVRLLGSFAEAVLDGRKPPRDAALFVAGAISAWLAQGGNLERDFLRVIKAKSHHTPAHLWRLMMTEPEAPHQDERHDSRDPE